MLGMLFELFEIILSYLPWKEYYDICKKENIVLNFDIYFKTRTKNWIPKIDNVCGMKGDYVEMVKYLYEQKDTDTKNPLLIKYAIESENFNIIAFLHRNGMQITDKKFYNECEKGNVNIVKLFFSLDDKYVNNKYKYCDTASQSAIKSNNVHMVEYLRSQEYVFRSFDLSYACEHGDTEMVKCVLNSIMNHKYLRSPLEGVADIVAKRGNLELLKIFYSMNQTVSNEVFHQVVCMGFFHIIEYLMNVGNYTFAYNAMARAIETKNSKMQKLITKYKKQNRVELVPQTRHIFIKRNE